MLARNYRTEGRGFESLPPLPNFFPNSKSAVARGRLANCSNEVTNLNEYVVNERPTGVRYGDGARPGCGGPDR